MRTLFSGILFGLWGLTGAAQNLTGKWYGKITQDPGGFSELYDFDLYLGYAKTLVGESDGYVNGQVKVRISLSGKQHRDSVFLRERRFGVQEEYMPSDWVSCFKNMRLKYFRFGNREYLKGTWTGKSVEDKSACSPGLIVLARSEDHLQDFFDNGGFSVQLEEQYASLIPPPPRFDADFQKTAIRKVIELPVSHREVELRINDYLKEDNDTVSIYLNRHLLSDKNRISRKPLKINLYLDPSIPLHEVLLYAENLGQIPPNTSQLLIIDGRKTHRVMIESDKQKTAAVYLKYSP